MSGNSKRRRHEYVGEDVHNRQPKRKVVSILKYKFTKNTFNVKNFIGQVS